MTPPCLNLIHSTIAIKEIANLYPIKPIGKNSPLWGSDIVNRQWDIKGTIEDLPILLDGDEEPYLVTFTVVHMDLGDKAMILGLPFLTENRAQLVPETKGYHAAVAHTRQGENQKWLSPHRNMTLCLPGERKEARVQTKKKPSKYRHDEISATIETTGSPARVFIDTGIEFNLISHNAARAAGEDFEWETVPAVELIGISGKVDYNNTTLKYMLKQLPVRVGDQTLYVDCYLWRGAHAAVDIMLGTTFLAKHRANISYSIEGCNRKM